MREKKEKSPLPASMEAPTQPPRGEETGRDAYPQPLSKGSVLYMLLRLVTQLWRIRLIGLIGLIRPNKSNELNAPDKPLIIRWLPKDRLLVCKRRPFGVRLTAFCKGKDGQSHSACSAHQAHRANKPNGPDEPNGPNKHAGKVQGFASGRYVFADGKGLCGLICVHFLQMVTFLLTY